jgi:nucleoside-diphosphate-sugar epimerase
MKTPTGKILITGALGQIGTELSIALAQIYGHDRIIVSDVREPEKPLEAGSFEKLDVLDFTRFQEIIEQHDIKVVYHLASLLSGTSEKNPSLAWKLNIDPLLYLCQLAKDQVLDQIFWPSSIAVFGREIPKTDVGQEVPLNPATVYGITKLAGEKWCEYFHSKYGVDVRSIRYPGLISWKAPAGGGTTDYAVEIYHKAIEEGKYTSFIAENTAMPMLYMDDAIAATLKLMQAPAENLTVRTSYNLGGMSFTPATLAHAIQKEMPHFEIAYSPDFRQAIAESTAKKDWGLSYRFDIDSMTKDMLQNLKKPA